MNSSVLYSVSLLYTETWFSEKNTYILSDLYPNTAPSSNVGFPKVCTIFSFSSFTFKLFNIFPLYFSVNTKLYTLPPNVLTSIPSSK